MKESERQIAYFAYDAEGSEFFTYEDGYRTELGFCSPDRQARGEFVRALRKKGFRLRPATDLVDPDSVAPTTSHPRVAPRWAGTPKYEQRAVTHTFMNFGVVGVGRKREKLLESLPTELELQRRWKEQHEELQNAPEVESVPMKQVLLTWACGDTTLGTVVASADEKKLQKEALSKECPECRAKKDRQSHKEDRIARLKRIHGDAWEVFA